ncbi:hypothetical protein [Leptolyngbya sp. FACHB-261]|uniref:hypothetical protein n=1 Tax=Leptolyngbya sp. FACHB-261 TaxID=2692806 RepID=UPI0016871AD5|nr:hypothetical protein [Leptolyngbya sp. FACHB-261]MBD2099664.1 hypothetical protein [Leptolyngbya sp. FACHB-261]
MPKTLFWAFVLGGLLATPAFAQSAADLGTQSRSQNVSDLASPRNLRRGEFTIRDQSASECAVAPPDVAQSTTTNPIPPAGTQANSGGTCVQIPVGGDSKQDLLLRGQTGGGAGAAVLVPIR